MDIAVSSGAVRTLLSLIEFPVHFVSLLRQPAAFARRMAADVSASVAFISVAVVCIAACLAAVDATTPAIVSTWLSRYVLVTTLAEWQSNHSFARLVVTNLGHALLVPAVQALAAMLLAWLLSWRRYTATELTEMFRYFLVPLTGVLAIPLIIVTLDYAGVARSGAPHAIFVATLVVGMLTQLTVLVRVPFALFRGVTGITRPRATLALLLFLFSIYFTRLPPFGTGLEPVESAEVLARISRSARLSFEDKEEEALKMFSDFPTTDSISLDLAVIRAMHGSLMNGATLRREWHGEKNDATEHTLVRQIVERYDRLMTSLDVLATKYRSVPAVTLHLADYYRFYGECTKSNLMFDAVYKAGAAAAPFERVDAGIKLSCSGAPPKDFQRLMRTYDPRSSFGFIRGLYGSPGLMSAALCSLMKGDDGEGTLPGQLDTLLESWVSVLKT